MKMILTWLVLMLAATSPVAGGAVAEEASLPSDEIAGIWAFATDGYYLGFREDGRLCSGGSAESVAAGRWCNDYTLDGDVVTETCMGGPEDRDCPLGGGRCPARVSVDEAGRLTYRILESACDMLPHKMLPPAETGTTAFPALRYAYTLERVALAAGSAEAAAGVCGLTVAAAAAPDHGNDEEEEPAVAPEVGAAGDVEEDEPVCFHSLWTSASLVRRGRCLVDSYPIRAGGVRSCTDRPLPFRSPEGAWPTAPEFLNELPI